MFRGRLFAGRLYAGQLFGGEKKEIPQPEIATAQFVKKRLRKDTDDDVLIFLL